MAARTQPARGMRDFLPVDVRRRQYVIDVVRRTYERYGFEPLETPALENIETLTGKYGEEGNKLIFKVLRRGEHESSGETDLALRYDLTVPLARVVAEHRAQLPKFFRRYQIQPVWRADRPARGRFREFYQCDVDAIGSTSPLVEVELCAAVTDVLRELGFADFTLRMNHRAVLSGLLHAAGIDASRHGDALVAIDKMDKIGRDGVVREFENRQIAAACAERLLDAFTAGGTNDATLARLRAAVTDDAGRAGVENLAAIVSLASPTSAGPAIRIDPSLARGLSYYTGAIMEIAVADLAGSLGGGGRYDGLIGMFSGEQIPACGFSLGLERILVVMAERAMFPASADAAGPDVLVTVFEDRDAARTAEARRQSLALATDLRKAGLRVELYPEADKLGKQFKYAAAREATFAAVLGGDEIARGEVTLKRLATGDQESVPRADVAARIRSAASR
ncbi:MAG TPA: histidine--tRNA ligase [Vicinamibacterales bacterium]|nr:histidine--tRNA ligase [Vicinamibacterales bacterium]